MASSSTTSVLQIKGAIRHQVKILGYSLTTSIKAGNRIKCGTFESGGYQWAILYYPKGKNNNPNSKNTCDFISFYVRLLSEARDVDTFISFNLVEHTGIATQYKQQSSFFTYSTIGDEKGFHNFVSRRCLEGSNYIKEDSLIVECSLQVLKPSLEDEKNSSSVTVPPSNMHQHFLQLLQGGEGADISFKVKGETFVAHKSILAARSSVFRAELFGSMREGTARCIEIEDMEPHVFMALLYFIYTDMLHISDDCAEEGMDEDVITQLLMVAANRYDLARLRLICEEKLAKKIGSDNVVTTLVLAAQHNCQQLKEICLDYISSSDILHSFTETDLFASFVASCPSIYQELLAKVGRNSRT